MPVCLFTSAILSNVLGAATEHFQTREAPVITLSGDATEISTYLYLGSWNLPDEKNKKIIWKDALDLSFDKDKARFQTSTHESKLSGASRKQMTLDTEQAVFEKIAWKDSHISLIAFNGISPRKQTALVEIDTDVAMALYVNGVFVQELSAAHHVELGSNMLLPVSLEKGENLFCVKILSNGGHPRLRLSVILDRSRDFHAAWGKSQGFLSKQIYYRDGNSFETPVLDWDPLLDRMTVGAEVYDILNEKILFKKDALRNGNLVRDGGNVLGEGIYRITYKSNYSDQETATENFLVGSPRLAYNRIKKALAELSWDADEELNIEAQLRRAEYLFSKANFHAEDKTWQEGTLYTLGCLAEFIALKKKHTGNIFKNLPGLHIRGHISRIDNSKQFYRVFIPASYDFRKKLPLLLIMPTPVAARERPFIESPFLVSYSKVVYVCKFAEKHGFGVLWPGYRNALEGWTYESTHIEEILSAVETDYAIDNTRISLYGICAGAFFAGRLATTYPDRYAAIVYDRAIFYRNVESMQGIPGSIREWFNAINPSNRIIENRNISILVLNDGSMSEGGGVMELSRKFLDAALKKRTDVKYSLGQRKMGVSLWDSIFKFLSDCQNNQNSRAKASVLSEKGYAGPISEVFASPFIVVEGTSTNREEAHFTNLAIEDLKVKYRKQFHGAELVLKKDTDVTDEDVKKYSLVLVGNKKSNAVWAKLADKHPNALIPYSLPDAGNAPPARTAFAEVFRCPENQNNHLLLIGSDDLKRLQVLDKFDPFTSWFDCYIHEGADMLQRQHIIARRPKPPSESGD